MPEWIYEAEWRPAGAVVKMRCPECQMSYAGEQRVLTVFWKLRRAGSETSRMESYVACINCNRVTHLRGDGSPGMIAFIADDATYGVPVNKQSCAYRVPREIANQEAWNRDMAYWGIDPLVYGEANGSQIYREDNRIIMTEPFNGEGMYYVSGPGIVIGVKTTDGKMIENAQSEVIMNQQRTNSPGGTRITSVYGFNADPSSPSGTMVPEPPKTMPAKKKRKFNLEGDD